MHKLDRQIEDEGRDWFQWAFGTCLVVALALCATFCHHEVSHAQAHDVMPVLQRDAVYMPQVAK